MVIKLDFRLSYFLAKSIDKAVSYITIEAYHLMHVMHALLKCRGSSVVEQKPEELRVGGSIPFPGTIF